MTRQIEFFGPGLPYLEMGEMPGKLIIIEGSDGVGRSTQIRPLREWIELQGFGVVETGWTRSLLVGQTIQAAKAGHGMNLITFNLLYATDLADRLEHEVIPALRAGFVVLADRYIYTAIARARARNAPEKWIRDLFGFAVKPDLVAYLKADVKTLTRRKLLSSGLDYWEAGQDFFPGLDPYDSFQKYQARILREYDRLQKEFGFEVVDARRPVDAVQEELRKIVARLLNIEWPPPPLRPATES